MQRNRQRVRKNRGKDGEQREWEGGRTFQKDSGQLC